MAYMRNQLIAKGYPISKWRELIDEWIFSEDHRKIVKTWLLDGATIDEAAEKHNFSGRNASKIIAAAYLRLIEL